MNSMRIETMVSMFVLHLIGQAADAIFGIYLLYTHALIVTQENGKPRYFKALLYANNPKKHKKDAKYLYLANKNAAVPVINGLNCNRADHFITNKAYFYVLRQRGLAYLRAERHNKKWLFNDNGAAQYMASYLQIEGIAEKWRTLPTYNYINNRLDFIRNPYKYSPDERNLFRLTETAMRAKKALEPLHAAEFDVVRFIRTSILGYEKPKNGEPLSEEQRMAYKTHAYNTAYQGNTRNYDYVGVSTYTNNVRLNTFLGAWLGFFPLVFLWWAMYSDKWLYMSGKDNLYQDYYWLTRTDTIKYITRHMIHNLDSVGDVFLHFLLIFNSLSLFMVLTGFTIYSTIVGRHRLFKSRIYNPLYTFGAQHQKDFNAKIGTFPILFGVAIGCILLFEPLPANFLICYCLSLVAPYLATPQGKKTYFDFKSAMNAHHSNTKATDVPKTTFSLQ